MTATEYQEYLNSIHWKQFRKWILKIRGGACEECGMSNVWAIMAYGQPLNVHHMTYANLGQEKEQDVRVLCRGCHSREHGAVLPDLGNVFWKLCRALKEAPDKAWAWLQSVDELRMCESDQLALTFT